MNTHKLTYLVCAVLVLIMSICWPNATSHAVDVQSRNVPNLEGTWNVSIEEMCLPDGYASFTATMVITNQIGSVFEGHFPDPSDPIPDYFTGAILGRAVRITDADYSEGTGIFDDITIFSGMLKGHNMILGTHTHWDKDELEGSCTGNFKAVKEVIQ